MLAFFLEFFFRGGAKSIVMQISFVMLIFLLFWTKYQGAKVSEGGAPSALWKKAKMEFFNPGQTPVITFYQSLLPLQNKCSTHVLKIS